MKQQEEEFWVSLDETWANLGDVKRTANVGSSIGRASVSKTDGCRFETYPICQNIKRAEQKDKEVLCESSLESNSNATKK